MSSLYRCIIKKNPKTQQCKLNTSEQESSTLGFTSSFCWLGLCRQQAQADATQLPSDTGNSPSTVKRQEAGQGHPQVLCTPSFGTAEAQLWAWHRRMDLGRTWYSGPRLETVQLQGGTTVGKND